LAKLNLNINGNIRPYTDIYLDGQRIKTKKIAKNKYGIEYETTQNTVELYIQSYSRLHARFWLLIELFYFIISTGRKPNINTCITTIKVK